MNAQENASGAVAFRKREAGLGIILLFFQLFKDQIEFHKKYFQKQRKNMSKIFY